MDNAASLDVLHRLFESLAPIVFRPVDILLKTLLQTPDNLVSESVDFIISREVIIVHIPAAFIKSFGLKRESQA